MKCPRCDSRMVDDEDSFSAHCPDCGWGLGAPINGDDWDQYDPLEDES